MKGALTLACDLAVAIPPTVQAQAPGGNTAPSAFDAMNQLVGRWKGLYRDGAPGAVTYRLTGAGTSLVETLLPGTPQEMTTADHENAAGELVGTRTCMAGNQPEFEAIRAGPLLRRSTRRLASGGARPTSARPGSGPRPPAGSSRS